MSQSVTLRSSFSDDASEREVLLLEFALQGDRFVTRLRWSGEEAFLVESLEGIENESENANWPRSSPLQEVVPQSDANGDYLAGIGRAGKSHWSVIVRPLSDRLGFDFDFACRVKENPVRLGSTYQVRAQSGFSMNLESSDAQVERNDSVWCVTPHECHLTELPATVRWRYQMVLG